MEDTYTYDRTLKQRYPDSYARVTCIKCGAEYRVCTRLICQRDMRELGQKTKQK